MPDSPISDALLARFLAGEATPAEDRSVQAWMATDPAHQREVAQLRAAWQAGPSAPSFDVDRAFRRVAAQLSAADPAPPIPIRRSSGWRPQLLRLAAAIALVVGGGLVWRTMRAPTEMLYQTLEGESREVTLADGSIAFLAPRSTLRVPGDYGVRSREVQLDGEAWFSAVHEGMGPLTVRTPTVVVRDVGTVFTVRARDTSLVEVAVIEGEVAVAPVREGSPLERRLVAGDVGRFQSGTVDVAEVTSGRPVDSLSGWRRGELRVESVPVSDVLRELSRWYGISLTVADSTLAQRPITATLSLIRRDAALEVLGLLLGATPRQEGSGIVFR